MQRLKTQKCHIQKCITGVSERNCYRAKDAVFLYYNYSDAISYL